MPYTSATPSVPSRVASPNNAETAGCGEQTRVVFACFVAYGWWADVLVGVERASLKCVVKMS